MTNDQIRALEVSGLTHLVYSTQSKQVLAAFIEEDDADLFREVYIPARSPWALAKIVDGRVIDITTEEVVL
jgi:hypothetical protein